MLGELRGSGDQDYALYAVASRELADLARSS
jgi:NAD-specific glutamate dehydrogenase